MKYLVFVDIDGVLTSTRVHFADDNRGLIWSKFDPIAIEFFNKIHDTYEDVEFVLISTWRDHLPINGHTTLWVESAFRSSGFRGNFHDKWKVNPENDTELWVKRRAHEIKHFLENYAPECKDYIIFDDSDYLFADILGKRRHIKTDPDNGILFRHMRDASAMMGVWDRKDEY